ncbi:ras-related protein Rab-30 isoform X2 [Schistocerca americana]|uniref:ras-related protein Rab-30 isoform X2 n=1 Tax=Schistocerca americana TaxID=7009 RepID=UPI001F501360|nr:ras-related protein Rab-30 isoform X2 [Schistocerca americana]XP_047117224.1 ras-related protein Rab-30 isoform X2 [Schistocerca piceifrons]XP_049815653.1 ras-related protein Rab-30 isoform X1 [Schistocerca nitens]
MHFLTLCMASVKVPEQKVILCGEYGVGKSSLFRRYSTNTFVTATDRQSTLGLDHFDREYKVSGKHIKLQLWDTGGMERVASITSSYYKFAEAAILVFALDNAASFHVLSQHLLDIVTYAENAKIFLCGNKSDLEGHTPQVTESDMESFCEQCHNLISATYKTSCKTGEGVEEMFADIAHHLVQANRSRLELQTMDQESFKISAPDEATEPSCLC